MRKRTAAAGGAGIAGLLALGLMYLPDMDFGSFGVSTGENSDRLTIDPTDADADDVDPAPRFDGEDADTPEMVDAGAEGGPGDLTDTAGDPVDADGSPLAVVDVLVDGGEYYVLRRFASDGLPIREAMSLDAVAELATQVEGAPDGVKVRIARRPNATAGAALDLEAALTSAGLEDDEVDSRTRLVDGDPAQYPGEGGYDGGPRPSDVPGRDLP